MNDHEFENTPDPADAEPAAPPPRRSGAWKTPSFALPMPPALPLPPRPTSLSRALPPAETPPLAEAQQEEEPPLPCTPEVDSPSPEIDFVADLDSLCQDLLGPDDSAEVSLPPEPPPVPRPEPPAPLFAVPSKGAQGSERLWSAYSEKGVPPASLPDSSCTTDTPLEPRLRLAVAAPPRAARGELVTFRLTVENTGTGSASDVLVRANCEGANSEQFMHSFSLLTPGQSETVELTAASDSDQLTFRADARSAEGCSATVSVPVTLTSPKLEVQPLSPDRVEPSPAIEDQLAVVNAGTEDASAVEVESEVTAELDFISTNAEVAPLPVSRLTLALDGPERVFVGEELEYRLNIANVGTAASSPTEATCRVPGESTLVSASDGGYFAHGESQIGWEGMALSPGESRTLSFRLTTTLPATVSIQARCGEASAEKELVIAISEGTSTGLLDRLLAEVDREMGSQVAPKPVETPNPLASTEEGERFLLFALAGIHYAIPADRVLEVGRPPRVTPVPNVPDWVLGLTNVRGDITSVVDLRNFLGLDASSESPQNRMLIVQSHTRELTTALLVDCVFGIRRIPPETFQAAEAVADDRIGPLVRGVGEYSGGLLVALDLDHLLQGEEMRQFEFA